MMPPIFLQNWLPGGFHLRMGSSSNDLHKPSAHILEGPIQTHPDADPTLRGSDPSASITTSPADVTMVALDQTD